MKSFFKKLTGFGRNLTRLSEDEPVTKLALAVIILLDIFILSVVFGGLDDHTAQLTSPAEYFPHECRQVFIEKGWTPANEMARLQTLVLVDYNNYSYRHDSPFKESRIKKMHPLCAEFYDRIRRIAEKKELKSLFIKRQDAGKKKAELVAQYDRENEVYDSKLLEHIAGTDRRDLESISQSLKSKSEEIDRLDARIKEIDRQLNSDPFMKDFWAMTKPGKDERRQTLIDDLNRYERWYLLKEFLWQLLFLVPLLVLFSLWHSRSVRKDRGIQSLISAHLIVVASIPAVLKVINVVMELIPYHFFKDLFEILEQLHIIALWHYGVIVLSIAAGIFFVFIIQKKIFNKERLREKRLMKGVCYACGKKLPEAKSPACPFCGAKQLKECAVCGVDTYIKGKFCAHCGQEQSVDCSLRA